MSETGTPQKPFIEVFSNLCLEYASLEQRIHNAYRAGGISKNLKDNERKRDELYGNLIQSTAGKLLSTDPDKRLNFINEIESENKRLKDRNEMLTNLFNPGEFLKNVMLKAIEVKEQAAKQP